MKFFRCIFWILLGTNLILRGYMALYVDSQPVFDFARYYQAATDLANGKGYIMFGRHTAFQGVGYPGFLALFFHFLGPSVLLAKQLNVLLSMFSAFCFYTVCRRFLSPSSAKMATLIYLYLPKEIVYVNVLGSEILFNTLLMAFFASYFCSWSVQKRGRLIWLVITGGILGLMSLVKPLSPALGLIIVIGEVGHYARLRKGWGKALLGTAIVALISVSVIAPWTYRNYRVFHAFIPVSTNGGYVLYVNNHPHATGMWMDPYTIPNSPIKKIPYPESDPRFEVMMNKMMGQAAKEWIIAHPNEFLTLCFYKFYYTFYTNWDWKWAYQSKVPLMTPENQLLLDRTTVVVHDMVASAYFLVFPALLIGYIRRKAKQRSDGFLALLLVGLSALLLTLITVVFEGNARYSFPLHPAFAIYTAVLLTQMRKMGEKYDL
jgi:hypothetical protein